MEDEITYIKPEELSFYADLKADVAAGKLARFSSLAVRSTEGHTQIAVRLPDGTQATADGTRFAESDWEECGRLEVHAIDPDDPLDQAAIEA